MAKKITTLLFIVLCTTGIYSGMYAYHVERNTPARAAQQLVQALAAGNTDQAYDQLAPELVAGREAYWHTFLKQLRPDGTPLKPLQESLKDTFNTYPAHSDPRRITYEFNAGGQPYQLVVIVIKLGQHWQVAELYGAAKA